MKINKKDARHWLYLAFVAGLILLFLPLRLIKKNKDKKAVILYGHKLNSNLNAIYEYYQNSEELQRKYELFFLTMDPHYYKNVKDKKQHVLLALKPRDVLTVVLSDVIITSHGLHSFLLLLFFSNIKFIDVWHAIPYKGFTPEDLKYQRKYEATFVSSEFLKDIYLNKYRFNEELIRITGYGRTDLILQYHQQKDSIKSYLSIPLEKKVILFAPTWKQDSKNRNEIPFELDKSAFYSLLNEFADKNGVVFIVRYHLNSKLEELSDYQNLFFLSSAVFPNTEKVIAVSDALITDWSSIAFDMMTLDKPIVFIDSKPPFTNGFSVGPEYRVGDIVNTLNGFLSSLSQLCTEPWLYNKRFQEKYKSVKDLVYNSNLDGRSVERYFEEIEKISHKKRML